MPAGYMRGLGQADADAEAAAAVAEYLKTSPGAEVYGVPHPMTQERPGTGTGPRITDVSITPVSTDSTDYAHTIPVPSFTSFTPGSAEAKAAYQALLRPEDRVVGSQPSAGFLQSFAKSMGAVKAPALQQPIIKISQDDSAAALAQILGRKPAPSAFDTWAPRVAIGAGTVATVVLIGRLAKWW